MMTKIMMRIDGVPGVKGRPQVGRTKSGRVRVFSRDKTIRYEERLANEGRHVWPHAPILHPIKLSIVAVFPIAASWPKWKRALAVAKGIWHTSRPDLDNVIKIVGDGLNEVLWADDGQVCVIEARKQHGEFPCIWITVEALEEAENDMGHNGGPVLDDASATGRRDAAGDADGVHGEGLFDPPL